MHGGTQSRCWHWLVALTLREMTLHYAPANVHDTEQHALLKMLIYLVLSGGGNAHVSMT